MPMRVEVRRDSNGNRLWANRARILCCLAALLWLPRCAGTVHDAILEGIPVSEAPPELQPRIAVGGQTFEKRLLWENPDKNGKWDFVDVRFGRYVPGPDRVIGALSSSGAVFLTNAGASVRRVTFNQEWTTHPFTVTPKVGVPCLRLVEGLGDHWGYYVESSTLGEVFLLLDPDGNPLWSSTPFFWADAGDVNGDGKTEFLLLVGTGEYRAPWEYQGRRLSLHDVSGKELWAREAGGKDDWYPWLTVQILRAPAEGGARIVGVGRKEFSFLDAAGNLLYTRPIPGVDPDIDDHPWALRMDPRLVERGAGAPSEDLLLAYVSPGQYEVISVQEAAVVRRAGFTPMHPSRAALVRFRVDQPPYLAMTTEWFGTINRNHFCTVKLAIFDADGTKVYDEAFWSHEGSLGVVPSESGAGEDLVVAGMDKIWRYKLKAQ